MTVQDFLKNFMSASQREVLATLVKTSEERDHFYNIMTSLADRVERMPGPYEQDGKGENAIAYLHYFLGGMDWYITERDSSDEQHQAFGRADIGYGPELGYISIQELIDNNVELDFYFEPKPLSEV